MKKIIIVLDDAVNDFEINEMIENFNNEPWCDNAYIEECNNCNSCNKKYLTK